MWRWMVLMVGWLWLVGCAVGAGGAVSPTAVSCTPVAAGTAVIITLVDAEGQPATDVTVRYRYNEADWQELPERVSGRAVIRGAAGRYQFLAQKLGYRSVETAVEVASTADGCGLVVQQPVFTFARAACAAPQPLTLQLLLPQENDQITAQAITPSGAQDLTCVDTANGPCQFMVPLNDFGEYRLSVHGLPGEEQLNIRDGVVDYLYQPYELQLAQGFRQQIVAGEGVNAVDLQFMVQPDEISCPLAEIATVQVTPYPDRSRPDDTVSADVNANILITDLVAPECRLEPELTDIVFELHLPVGTRLSEVGMAVWTGDEQTIGVCGMGDGRFLCTVSLLNPVYDMPYVEQVLINGEEYVTTSLPFSGVCILFRPIAIDGSGG